MVGMPRCLGDHRAGRIDAGADDISSVDGHLQRERIACRIADSRETFHEICVTVSVATYAAYLVSVVKISPNGICPTRCSCTAMKPGVIVRPLASMTVTRSAGKDLAILAILLFSISTSEPSISSGDLPSNMWAPLMRMGLSYPLWSFWYVAS